MTENFAPLNATNAPKEDALHPPLVSFSANMQTNIVCKLIIQDQINEILRQTPIALKGVDIEGVHKMRVGFRRLRTGLKIFKPIIKKSTYQYFQSNLKHAGQILGNIRDLDVLYEDMIIYQSGQDRHLIDNYWQLEISPQYNQYRNELTSLISSPQYKNLFSYLSAFCSETNTGIKTTQKLNTESWSIKDFSSTRMTIFLENMLAYADVFDFPQPYQTYHQLRKEAKKFRYAVEFFLPILKTAHTEILIQNLVILQDHLGNLNDTVVASDIFNDLGLKPPLTLKNDNHQNIVSYFESRNQERNWLIENFKATWETFLNSSPQLLLEKSIQ